MPFCRKCGRRLCEYSENCPECGTSTTAPLIKIKKVSVTHSVSAIAPKKVAKEIIPAKAIIPFKITAPSKAAKAGVTAKAFVPKSIIPAKPVTSAKVYPKHEIVKSNISLKEDLIANPQDYETQTFGFDLKCPQGHFWPAGKTLPVSNGKALCLQCGERVRKPKRKNDHRFRTF